MTWREIIEKSSRFLIAKGIDDGESASEFLAARLLGMTRGMLAATLAKQPEQKHIDAMRRGVLRLASGEPLQYILVEWDFRSLTLKCDRRALIPRPETEGLVSLVLSYLAKKSYLSAPFIVDVGTGTGAIILSIAKEYKGEAILLGSDISEEAIKLAKENAAKTKLENRVEFVVMDGLDDFEDPGIIDIIISNPPYIASAECDRLDRRVKDFEPRLALDGGKEGLDFYDRYLMDALNLLKSGGAVFFEIGESQGEQIRKLMRNYGFENIEIRQDLAGRDRYISGILP